MGSSKQSQCFLLAAGTAFRRPVPYVPFCYSRLEWYLILPGWQLSRATGGILHTPSVTGRSARTKRWVLSQTGSALKDHRNMCPLHKIEARKGGIRQEVMFDVFISNDKNKSDSNVTFFTNRSLFGVGWQSVLGVICKIYRICVQLNDGFFFHLPPFSLCAARLQLRVKGLTYLMEAWNSYRELQQKEKQRKVEG